MAEATSDSAVPEQPEQSEPTIEEIRASNKRGLWVLLALGALALATDDPTVRQAALKEGEALLQAGAVSHNHLLFRRDAIDAYLGAGDWEGAERSAAALEDYTRAEPLPFSGFYIARARALAARGGGRSDPTALAAELERLRKEGERLGLRVALPAIERAIKEIRG